MTTQMEKVKNEMNAKICPECGQKMKDKIEIFLTECDHCLSKKTE